MSGPFSLGDSLRVYRLQHLGIRLDLERGLMQSQTPLWEAWLALLTQQAMGQPTYVRCDPQEGEAFVQVRYRAHEAAADVAYLAPSVAEDRRASHAWLALLDSACTDVATRGVQRVFANLPERGCEVDVFHQAGFALYAGEDIYRRAHLHTQGPNESTLHLRPQRLEDWPALQKLCVAITPQRVRQAEGGISVATDTGRYCQRYLLSSANGEDLIAALTLCTRGLAHWMRVLVHPEAQIPVEGLIRWGLDRLAAQPARPVFCSVRRYEGGVRVPLETAGFELYAARALMVKHTVAWLKAPIQELVPTLKGGAEPVPPAYHISGETEIPVATGRLAVERKP